jgi:Alr-MurF fusion protein
VTTRFKQASVGGAGYPPGAEAPHSAVFDISKLLVNHAHMIRLDDLLAAGGALHGTPRASSFADFSYDSRLTGPGELFLALRTPHADGHDYIPAALAAGAAGVVCSWLPGTQAATVIVADDPAGLVRRWAAQRLLSVAPDVVAVTGSVGKTTTVRAIAELLAIAAPTFRSRQSFNSLLGLPIAIARLRDEHRFAVLEFGADRFGEIRQLAALFPPRVAVVTRVAEAHLDAFGTLDGVAREKGALVEALPADGWAILNGDDPRVLAMRERTRARVLTFGLGEECDLYASDVRHDLDGTRFRMRWNGLGAIPQHDTRRHELLSDLGASLHSLVDQKHRTGTEQAAEAFVPLVGEPAVMVGLAAVSVALVCGLTIEHATHALAQVEPPAGRLRRLPGRGDATLLDDSYGATPAATIMAVRTLGELPAPRPVMAFRRRIALLGEPGTTEHAVHEQIGALAGATANILICKGDWGLAAVRAARRACPSIAATVVYTAAAALAAVPPDLGPSDLLLVKGSAEARMERVAAGLLGDGADAPRVLVRQHPGWHSVRAGAPDRPTWVRIDLDAIAHNVRRLRSIAGVPLMITLKADAYGHGAVRAGRVALASGASALAVATLGEARELRAADITAPILVFGYTPPWQARDAVGLGLTCTVFDFDAARALSESAEAAGRVAVVHVKIDTGLARLGIASDQAMAFLRELAALPHLCVEGIYTHLATADSADEAFARFQIERFAALVRAADAAGCRPPIAHAANSAALLRFPDARFDMVRPGIACYGLRPSEQTPLPPDFRPALEFRTEVAQVKQVPEGAPLSYGGAFVTARPSVIATIPAGYADGFRRVPSWREVLVRGERAPVVGRVAMDYALIDVTDIAGVHRGDPVVLIGAQGRDTITADEVAAWLGTISYDVVATILPRVPREVQEGWE